MKNLQRRHELHVARDGVEALDFLHRRGPHAQAQRPHLILLDINMPRLGGLETLSAIKSDPELCVIPVIMLSTSCAPHDVQRSYLAHANGYLQKPADLERSEKLIRAMDAFWIEFALMPEVNDWAVGKWPVRHPGRGPGQGQEEPQIGPPIAREWAEARSRARSIDDSPDGTVSPSKRSGCGEQLRLLDELGAAVQALIELHEEQFRAIVEGDTECYRFDLLIHMANEKKQLAKYNFMRHVEEHGCSKLNAIDDART